MRACLPRAITVAQANALSEAVGYLDFEDPKVSGLVRIIREFAPISTVSPAYCRVEHRPEGHPWHQDTGTIDHMAWCKYSASILLTDPKEFTGGGFYFRDNPDDPIFHYLDLLFFSGGRDNAHQVTRNSGERKALIMFFGEQGDS